MITGLVLSEYDTEKKNPITLDIIINWLQPVFVLFAYFCKYWNTIFLTRIKKN